MKNPAARTPEKSSRYRAVQSRAGSGGACRTVTPGSGNPDSRAAAAGLLDSTSASRRAASRRRAPAEPNQSRTRSPVADVSAAPRNSLSSTTSPSQPVSGPGPCRSSGYVGRLPTPFSAGRCRRAAVRPGSVAERPGRAAGGRSLAARFSRVGGASRDPQFSRWGPRLKHSAARRSSLRFGRNTPGLVLPAGARPSRALSAGPPPGELAPPGELGLAPTGRIGALGAHATLSTGCQP